MEKIRYSLEAWTIEASAKVCSRKSTTYIGGHQGVQALTRPLRCPRSRRASAAGLLWGGKSAARRTHARPAFAHV
ncbi:hypothetical protein BN6_57350 [Saccharothrix espanaensis DSM 44229]|uniref:Uncharacterized protein n=1 Tax=Saccharothrix espanaensis (strain ATCC 51144 / DSM 44229 / JCM 9112 / NBRC 15066 / NRRL 15764) TaxID=1179773 RepID=K0K8M5_SACES|nr:hypothetical protein BN6_57350 [Saccharothrix espanaensis DSM 44229]